ncbi:hypothetical protein PHMEG_00040952, partial [Phytophthora megakarya]
KTGISIRSYAEATLSTTRSQHLSDSAVQVRIEESEQATLCTTLSNRPLNSKRKYTGYQDEFMVWCNKHQFFDGGTVTKGKLHLFLTERDVGREAKKKKARLLEAQPCVDCGVVNHL